MKKKGLFAIMAAIVMCMGCFAFPLSACGSDDDPEEIEKPDEKPEQKPEQKPDEKLTLIRIELDVSDVRKTFDIGDEFTYEGLKVYAVKRDSKGVVKDPVLLSLDSVTVDSAVYDNKVEDDYRIVVSYTEGNRTETDYYFVNVSKSVGLNVKKTNCEYEFAAAGTEIDCSDIVVKYATAAKGVYGDPLAAAEYNLYYVYGDENVKHDITSGKFTADRSGTYQIWAEKTDAPIPGTSGETVEVSDFVLVYVTDELVGLELEPGATLSQSASVIDLMTHTWKFKATYKSGVVEEHIGVGTDLKVSPVTNVVGADKKVNATYTVYSGNGQKQTATAEVTYTITTAATTTQTTSYSFSALKATIEKTKLDEATDTYVYEDHNYLSQKNFTGVNSFLTVLPGSQIDYRAPKNDRLEIKGEQSLMFYFDGVGTAEITVRSNSSGNTSSFGLIQVTDEGDVIGTHLVAQHPANANITDADNNIYLVKGNSGLKFTFVITQPGYYALCQYETVFVNGTPSSAYDRPFVLDGLKLIVEKDNGGSN